MARPLTECATVAQVRGHGRAGGYAVADLFTVGCGVADADSTPLYDVLNVAAALRPLRGLLLSTTCQLQAFRQRLILLMSGRGVPRSAALH